MFLDQKKLIGLGCKSCGNTFMIGAKYMDKTYIVDFSEVEKLLNNY